LTLLTSHLDRELVGALAASAAVIAGCMFFLWLLSLRLKDASIADLFWAPGFFVCAWVSGTVSEGVSWRRWLVLGLIGLWAARLSLYLAFRNLGRGEDKRYQVMRAAHGKRFVWVSFLTVFLGQGILMWIVSFPLQCMMVADRPETLGGLSVVGAALALLGIGCEALADHQLRRFLADPERGDAVMDRGLWRYSRHPNYFGNALMWWGLVVLAWEVPRGPWGLLSALVMTTLLLRVSGVRLLESTITQRRPGYEAYIHRTSAFVPWFPKSP
jgi:steroid 5-alpha reductase family enzyme